MTFRLVFVSQAKLSLVPMLCQVRIMVKTPRHASVGLDKKGGGGGGCVHGSSREMPWRCRPSWAT